MLIKAKLEIFGVVWCTKTWPDQCEIWKHVPPKFHNSRCNELPLNNCNYYNQTDCKPGADNISGIQINDLLEANCKYVNRNVEISIVIQCFRDKIIQNHKPVN